MADDEKNAAAQKKELNESLKEYIHQWRDERKKEEEELKRLKEKQAKRKEIRAEQEKAMAKKKKDEEDKLRKEEAEKKAIEAEAKKKQMEEAEIKRQEMLAAQKEKGGGKKSSAPAMDAHKELAKSKEQVEEECKISLNIRIKPLPLNEMDSDELRGKANQIWNLIVELETDKYDYEQRHMDQDYEFKELKERQKLQQRNKAIKKGLDPESFTGAHPPKIHMFSKYERQVDSRPYVERKKLYEGGAEVMRSELIEAAWKEKLAEWQKRQKHKLPKWFGIRPGKKEGDPETPEGEEDVAEEPEEAEEEYEEEEEEEEEEE